MYWKSMVTANLWSLIESSMELTSNSVSDILTQQPITIWKLTDRGSLPFLTPIDQYTSIVFDLSPPPSTKINPNMSMWQKRLWDITLHATLKFQQVLGHGRILSFSIWIVNCLHLMAINQFPNSEKTDNTKGWLLGVVGRLGVIWKRCHMLVVREGRGVNYLTL